jgi:hypothetical protein
MDRQIFVMMILLLFAAGASIIGQSRNDVVIYINPTTGGNLDENQFFDDNLRMEVTAANYTVTENREEADYLLVPKVTLNTPTDEILSHSLVLQLMRTVDGTELIQVGVDYDQVTETYEWNLYLIYQAMANVPLTKTADTPPPPLQLLA